jgi:GNAT superfamily N-acetyltransferase
MRIDFAQTAYEDIEALADIRIRAMRESLARIGRFNIDVARARLVESYDPLTCRFIVVDGNTAGMVDVRKRAAHVLVHHLYLLPAYQGVGIGSTILREILADARGLGLPVITGALRGSEANRFYLQHGFVKTGSKDVDNYYVFYHGDRP